MNDITIDINDETEAQRLGRINMSFSDPDRNVIYLRQFTD